ncbi:hypothetical protein HY213_04050 [Candidatus Peregrinibacteria bacterium]|nr:hypothetical protein [Candidatus Peregrinibacteria bacterium]
MSVLLFCLTAMLLVLEGTLFLRIAFPRYERLLCLVLGYPVAALFNVLLFFVMYAVGLRWNAEAIGMGHGLVMILLIGFWMIRLSWFDSAHHDNLSNRQREKHVNPSPSYLRTGFVEGRHAFPWIIIGLCILSLCATFFYAATHALILPSYYIDTVSNWNLRSRAMLSAGTLLTEGVVKPQYPILLHALQMLFMLPLERWNDTAANAATFLLSLSSFLALFLLVRRDHGAFIAFVMVTALVSVPLVTVHLGQGFGDIHLIQYVLLSAFLLERGIRLEDRASIALSALLVIASAWTKLEGFYEGIGFWLLLWIGSSLVLHRTIPWRILFLFLLALPWPLFVKFHHMLLSPHGRGFEFHVAAIPLALLYMGTEGSFGIAWYVLPFCLLILFTLRFLRILPRLPVPLLWGLLALAFAFVIFFCTAEVQGLYNQESFHRVLLVPLLLLIEGCVMGFVEVFMHVAHTTPPSS